MLRFRPRLRFSLRTLLVLVMVLCVPLCWLGYQLHWLRQRREARATQAVIDFSGSASVPAPGLLWLFGERGYPSLLVTRARPGERDWLQAEEIDINRAQALFPEARIDRLRFQPQHDSTSAVQP